MHIGIALAIASACGGDGARGEESTAGSGSGSASSSLSSDAADGSPASTPTSADDGDDGVDDGDATSPGTSAGTSDDDGATLGGSSTTSADATTDTGGGTACEQSVPGVTLLGCDLGAPDGRLVADAQFVYAPAGEAIHRVALDGSGAALLTSVVGGARDLALGGGALFYAAFAAGAVGRIDPADGTEAWLVDGLVSPSCIVVDASFVYVSEHGEDAAIVRIPIAGGDPEPLYPMLDYPGTLATVATDLYFTTGNDSTFAAPVYRGPLAGPAPATLILSTTGLMTELVPFGDTIYFDRQSAVGTAITAMPIATPFAPMTLETTENLTLGLAVTSERVVWTETDEATWRLRSVTLGGDDLVDHVDDSAAFGDVLSADDTVLFLGYGGVARLD